MYVRNKRKTTLRFNYRVNGQAAAANIAPNTIVNFPTITSINQVIFDPLEATQRKANEKFGRNIDTGVEYRMTPGLTGTTL